MLNHSRYGLLLVGTAVAAACSDGPLRSPDTAVPSTSYEELQRYDNMVTNGDFSTYQVQTTFVMHEGEYVDLEGPDVQLQQTFDEQHTWQGGGYDATLTFPTPDNSTGPDGSPEFDVARVHVSADGEPVAYGRSGELLEIPAEEASSFAAMARGPLPSLSSPGASGQARDRREAVDRLFVTHGGSARVLASLRRSLDEKPGRAGEARFLGREGAVDVEYRFDMRLGAVREIITGMPGGMRSHVVREYATSPRGHHLLTREHTVVSDPQGQPLGRFSLLYNNLTLR